MATMNRILFSKRSIRGSEQVAALPLRSRDGQVEVCLITTRETRRWTVPKGWPMRGCKDYTAAAIEAEEEAGLIGKISKQPIGAYQYRKRRASSVDLVRVNLYRMDVTGYLTEWPEQAEREVRWFPCQVASSLVEEPDLRSLIASVAANEDEALQA